jgi:hypothetical protein
MKQLKQGVLDQVAKSGTVKGMIADTLDRSVQTVESWVKQNDIMLTTIDSLGVIKKMLGHDYDKAVEEIPQPEVQKK